MPLAGFEQHTTHDPETLAQARAIERALQPHSNAHPLRSDKLEAATGFKGPVVRALVNALRLDGVPVCSNSRGYYMARSLAELDQTIKHLRQRAASIQQAAAGLEVARARLETPDNQPSLF